MPSIAVVIPTLNEARALPGLLRDLEGLRVPTEVIVADGGSSDGTVEVAERRGATVVVSRPGRGRQLNAGAALAGSAWLCFMHADVRLPEAARRDLEATAADAGAQAAVWRLRIDAAGPVYRIIERGARARDRWLGLPYGDQGLLVRREVFDAAGGYPDAPIMEDVALVRALRRHAPLRRLPSCVVVSARRWAREGPVRATARNALLVAAYHAGVPPARLVRWYAAEPS